MCDPTSIQISHRGVVHPFPESERGMDIRDMRALVTVYCLWVRLRRLGRVH